jgi:hypothetical protein
MDNRKHPKARTPLALFLPLLLILAACSQAQSGLETTLQPVTQRPNTPSPPQTTFNAPGTNNPMPTPGPPESVWFAPNMGSTDYTRLFSNPEFWPEVRSRIDVFKFYTQNVFDPACSICGGNSLSAFVAIDAFRRLIGWGIAIALEVGAVKEWGCTGTDEFNTARAAIEHVQTNGGTVAALDMDEPFIGGQHVINGRTCGYTMGESADVTAQFVQQVNNTYPDIRVGDVEPYPYFSIPELELWLAALEQRGVSLAHFHLDVDMVRVLNEGLDVGADLQRLGRFLQERRIPFGVIFTSNLNWSPASDCDYFVATMEWIRTVKSAIGKPEHVIFQSWLGPSADGLHEIPMNLPENGAGSCSHTYLILKGLALLDD